MMNFTIYTILLGLVIYKSWLLCEAVMDCPLTMHSGCQNLKDGVLRCNDHFPDAVPNGTVHVVIQCLGKYDNFETKEIYITDGTFRCNGWGRVHYLEINLPYFEYVKRVKIITGAFKGLSNLTVLKLNLFRSSYEKGIFDPLVNLKILDLSGSLEVSPSEFYNVMGNASTLPRLDELSLHNVGKNRHERFDLDKTFWNTVFMRAIKNLDISGMNVNQFDVAAFSRKCDTLIYLNISSLSNIDVTNFVDSRGDYCKNLDVVNITAPVPKRDIFSLCNVPLSVKNANGTIDIDRFSLISAAHTIILNSICAPNHGHITIYNSFGTITPMNKWRTKRLYISQINLNVLDVQIDCGPVSLETLWLTDINIEYASPPLHSCAKSIRELNLSGNRFEVMRMSNGSVFEKYFKPFYNLQNLYLSRNGLTTLPFGLFSNNTLIQRLDLSINFLTSIHFSLSGLKYLGYLDLSDNNFANLDATSISILKSIPRGQGLNNTIVFVGNTFSCEYCTDGETIDFLASSCLFETQTLSCYDGTHNIPVKDESTSRNLNRKCTRTRTILLGTLVPVICIVFVCFLTYAIRRQRQKRRRVEDIRNKLHQGGFVAFLSYSSSDFDFIENNVFDHLNQQLQKLTEIERDLVCTGDRNFRLGVHLNDAICECLSQSATFIALVTEDYCRSGLCKTEFNMAVERKMPIVLMLKDHVSPDLMPPNMRERFLLYSRILWMKQGAQYELKTSWANVCHSILKSIEFQNKDAFTSPKFVRCLAFLKRLRRRDGLPYNDNDDEPLLPETIGTNGIEIEEYERLSLNSGQSESVCHGSLCL